MAATRQAPDVVQFGEFELDLRTGELARDHRRVPLPDQPFRLLALLIRERGALVTRDTLRHELWSDDTFVDFDAGLNAAIKRLRETLGDAASSPTFIETLPRRGYRFIAPVEERRAPRPVEAEEPVPEASAKGRPGRPWYPAVAAGLLAVVAALVAIMVLRPRAPASGVGEQPRQAGMSRVTNLGTVRRAFVSPDGNDLVYARDEGTQQSLWIRRGRRADAVRILGPMPGNFESLALGPGGMVYYAFFSFDRANRSLYRLPIRGGTARAGPRRGGSDRFQPRRLAIRVRPEHVDDAAREPGRAGGSPQRPVARSQHPPDPGELRQSRAFLVPERIPAHPARRQRRRARPPPGG